MLYILYVFNFSINFEKAVRVFISQKSLGQSGIGIFGMGITVVLFLREGKIPISKDKFIMCSKAGNILLAMF